MTDKRTISIYDSKSSEYANLTKVNKPSKHLSVFMSNVIANGIVLDLGCGPGVASYFMKKKGFKVTATDASMEMVKIAKAEMALMCCTIRLKILTGSTLLMGSGHTLAFYMPSEKFFHLT